MSHLWARVDTQYVVQRRLGSHEGEGSWIPTSFLHTARWNQSEMQTLTAEKYEKEIQESYIKSQRWLRVLAALAEDPNTVPNTHPPAQKHLKFQFQ